jgi:hypothetical protein
MSHVSCALQSPWLALTGAPEGIWEVEKLARDSTWPAEAMNLTGRTNRVEGAHHGAVTVGKSFSQADLRR